MELENKQKSQAANTQRTYIIRLEAKIKDLEESLHIERQARNVSNHQEQHQQAPQNTAQKSDPQHQSTYDQMYLRLSRDLQSNIKLELLNIQMNNVSQTANQALFYAQQMRAQCWPGHTGYGPGNYPTYGYAPPSPPGPPVYNPHQWNYPPPHVPYTAPTMRPNMNRQDPSTAQPPHNTPTAADHVNKQYTRPETTNAAYVNKQYTRPETTAADYVNKQYTRPETSAADYVNKQYTRSETTAADYVNKQYTRPETNAADYVNKQYTRPETTAADYVNKQNTRPETSAADYVNKQNTRPERSAAVYVNKQYTRPEINAADYVNKQYTRPETNGEQNQNHQHTYRPKRRPNQRNTAPRFLKITPKILNKSTSGCHNSGYPTSGCQ